MFDQGKNNKQFSEKKRTDRQDHVQDNAAIPQKDIKYIVTQINSQH